MSIEPHWSLSEAKARLLEILERAHALPQVIADAGRPCAVVLSLRDFEDISGFSRRRLRNLLLAHEETQKGKPTAIDP
ncbi:MAG: type II toxin-antitoxin system Phd/YefM family antitoxin [Silvanigrellales bacterium]|jgi:prevent-host-death family protein|nr:type II toxin-antitoxin system Phd/YefM family antitoxin [Silvanigrellales bacterium]